MSQLKKMLGEWNNTQSHEPTLIENYEWIVDSEEVLGIRWSDENNWEELLVKWLDRPYYDATWEDPKVIKSKFPDSHLEEKVVLNLRGIVRPQ